MLRNLHHCHEYGYMLLNTLLCISTVPTGNNSIDSTDNDLVSFQLNVSEVTVKEQGSFINRVYEMYVDSYVR